MKKYINWIKISASMIVFSILLISLFNYKIDSLGLFGNSSYLVQAAKALTNGQMIAGLKDTDDRIFQELIIKNLHVKNDVIAIGSSRTMQLRKRFIFEYEFNFFNHSVSGASLEDYIAITGIYEAIHGYIPPTIILGIDPWIFNKNNGQSRWKSLEKYNNMEMHKINKNYLNNKLKINTLKWKQLINYDYTISNIKNFQTLLTNEGKAFYITDTIEIDDSIKESDGSIHYPYKTRYAKENEIKNSAIAYSKKPVYSLEKFSKIDNQQLFENFIKYLQSKDIKIIFFLPPYNPITYNKLIKQQEYEIITVVEKYLKNLSYKYDIVVKGSYDPNQYGFSHTDFTDGMHGRENVAQKIFKHK